MAISSKYRATELVLEASRICAEADSLDDAVRRLFATLRDDLSLVCAGIMTLSQDRERARLVTVCGVGDLAFEEGEDVEIASTALPRVVAEGIPLLVDPAACAGARFAEMAEHGGIVTCIAIPLRDESAERVVGLLNLGTSSKTIFDEAGTVFFFALGAAVERRVLELLASHGAR